MKKKSVDARNVRHLDARRFAPIKGRKESLERDGTMMTNAVVD